jgi:Putative zinc binding domain
MNLLGTRSTRNRDLARPPAVIKGKHWLIFCRVRDSIDLEPVVDLGNQPWCNHFLKREELGKEPSYPLRLVFCERCCTSQLDYTLKKQVMFGDHTCLSDVTHSLSNISEVDQRFFADLVSRSPSGCSIGSPRSRWNRDWGNA